MADKINDFAAIVRTMMDQEREQVDRRITWLATFQGFLFAALAFAWDKDKTVVLILASLGILFALLILFGLLAGVMAVGSLRKYWLEHKPANYDGPEVWGLSRDQPGFFLYAAPENLIPVALMIAWLFVFIIKIRG